MSDIKDFKNKNTEFTGTKGIDLPEGTEAQRVDEQGILRFNTDTSLAEYYDGTSWKPIDSPPTIASVSPASWTSDGTTQQTFTVTGSNFQSGATAKFVGNDGTEYTSTNLNVASSSSFTLQNMTTMGVANEPYDIIFTNPSGLAATLEDAIDAGNNPSFTTAADTNVLTSYEGGSAPFGETTLVATDSTDSQTVTHTISAGALPPGMSLSSAGALTGTVSGSSQQDYTFTVRGSDGFNTVDRQFVITIGAPPYVVATGGTETTSGDYKIHSFTGPGTFTVSNAGTPSGPNVVSYMVVAGGGSGGQNNGGGGGAGGFREGYDPGSYTASPLAASGVTVSVTSYPITIGGGGSGNSTNGSNSSALSRTSSGGGAGARDSAAGSSGGSGGGGGHDVGGGGGPGSGNSPPVSPPQGQPGGAISGTGAGWTGAGGGGALQAGQAGTPAATGAGGDGAQTSIRGSATFYAGGGGGSNDAGYPNRPGGDGGGGNGGTNSGSGQAGSGNTGGGGGGADPGTGGSGGSGIVVIRYKYQ
jgi:hypothetical protein